MPTPKTTPDRPSGTPTTGSREPAPPPEAPPPGEAAASHGDDARDAATPGPDVRSRSARAPGSGDVVRRLRSVEGHVRGVQRMVEEGAYCIDVVNQIVAVQRALKKVSGLVLDRHLHTCVTTAIRSESPEERERVIEEILDVFDATGKG